VAVSGCAETMSRVSLREISSSVRWDLWRRDRE